MKNNSYILEIQKIKADIINDIRNLIKEHGIENSSRIPMSDGGKKYDGYYIGHSSFTEERKLQSVYLYDTKDSDVQGVAFTCGDCEDDLVAEEIQVENLSCILLYLTDLVNHKSDYEDCIAWWNDREDEI